MGRPEGAKRGHRLFDFALVEQALLVDLYPSFLADFVIGV